MELLGKTIHEIRVVDVLGQGGMGEVYVGSPLAQDYGDWLTQSSVIIPLLLPLAVVAIATRRVSFFQPASGLSHSLSWLEPW